MQPSDKDSIFKKKLNNSKSPRLQEESEQLYTWNNIKPPSCNTQPSAEIVS